MTDNARHEESNFRPEVIPKPRKIYVRPCNAGQWLMQIVRWRNPSVKRAICLSSTYFKTDSRDIIF